MGILVSGRLGMVTLWFNSWTPTTAGSTFGACVGLFLLAVVSRVLAVISAGAAQAWSDSLVLEREAHLALLLASANSASATSADKAFASSSSDESPDRSPHTLARSKEARLATGRAVPAAAGGAPPFRLAHDLPRGVLFALVAFVNYLLMLSVMTYDVWFFVAVLLGLGTGECAVGRFAPKHPHNALHLH